MMSFRAFWILLAHLAILFSLPASAKTYYLFKGVAFDSVAEAEAAATAYVQNNDLGTYIRLDEERQSDTILYYDGIDQATPFDPHVAYPCFDTICEDFSGAVASFKSVKEPVSTCNSSNTTFTRQEWVFKGWGRISSDDYPSGTTIIKSYSQDFCYETTWHQQIYDSATGQHVCIKKGPAGGCGLQSQRYHAWTCPENSLRRNPPGEFDTPECIKSTQIISKRTCHAPYDIDESSGLCVAYCPKSSPNLDPSLGVCVQPDDKVDPDQCATMAGNPIETRNGEKIHLEMPDFAGGGSFPLTFARNYKSGRLRAISENFPALEASGDYIKYEQPLNYTGIPALPVGAPNPDAQNPGGNVQWRHNYTKHLFVSADATKLLLTKADGSNEKFDNNGSGEVYLSKKRTSNRFVKQTDSSWLYIDGSGFTERYDDQGKLVSITNVEGLSQTLSYNPQGLLTSIADHAGRQITLSWDEYQRIDTMTAPGGQVTHYEYGNGNLVRVIHPDNTPLDNSDNPTTEYLYGNALYPNALTGLIDKNGFNYAQWTYDGNGKATASENYGGLKKTQINYADNLVTVTEANNHVRTLTFDSQDRLLSVSGGNCGQCGASDVASYSYDTHNQLATETDFNGVKTHYQYNNRGLVTRRTEAQGLPEQRDTYITWHNELALPLTILTPQVTREFVYDANGKILEVSETDNVVSTTPVRKITYSYDSNGRLSSLDGPRTDISDITNFTYHSNGDIASVTNPLGHVTQYSQYDANGRPLTIIDPNSITTNLSYDAMGRVLTSVSAGYTTSYEYDALGQMLRITEPGNISTQYTYNGARQLTGITDSAGNQVLYSYDNMNNITSIEIKDDTGALFSHQTRHYDNLNRLSSLVDGLNQTSSYNYDNVGNMISSKTPLLKETKQVYDALNRLIESETPDQKKTQYSYNAADELTSVSASNSAQTGYQLNGFSEVLNLDSPDTGVTVYNYDEAGNIVSKTDAKQRVTSYQYDALNRLTNISYSGEQTAIQLLYDTAANGKGQLAQLSDFSGTTSYSYNANSELSQKTSSVGNISKSVGYQYDATGQLSGITYPSGRQLTIARNANGQVTQLTITHNGQSQTLLSGATYYPLSAVKAYNLGNGIAANKSYDANGQLISSQDIGVLERSISYDVDSLITGISDALLPARNQTFTYDQQDRLSQSTGDYGQIDYSYDSVGNRLSKTVNSATQNWQYKAASNQLTGSFVHDANGNRTLDGLRSYQYNAENRLASVTETESGIKTDYQYNGLGQRVKKHNLFGTTLYFYDEDGLLLAETDGDGQIIKEYVYFNQQPIAMLAGE